MHSVWEAVRTKLSMLLSGRDSHFVVQSGLRRERRFLSGATLQAVIDREMTCIMPSLVLSTCSRCC